MAAELDRRNFLKAAAALASTTPTAAAAAQQEQAATAAMPPHRPRNAPPLQARLFLTDREAAFLAAAVDVMLPADKVGPGGVEAGVVAYMDRQLAGAWGNGARMYLNGPWAEGTPQQGYQLPLTPAQLFRAALPEVDTLARGEGGKSFSQLPLGRRDALLAGLDSGDIALPTISGRAFMELLRSSVIEGYFADPAYGGNRAMSAWRMIGFPGARGAYVDDMDQSRNRPFLTEPVSLADLQ